MQTSNNSEDNPQDSTSDGTALEGTSPNQQDTAGDSTSAKSKKPRKTRAQPEIKARFVEGPILRHIVVMSSTAALGLSFLFIVDLVDLYFIGLLGNPNYLAAAGYVAAIGFLLVSVGIGLMIATSVRVGRALGQGHTDEARRRATAAVIYSQLLGLPLTALLLLIAHPLVGLLNPTPAAHEAAVAFLYIVLPFMPIMLFGMACNGVLRGLADAKRSMYITLFGGIINGVLDPLFIFGFDWGFEGAAWATAISRLSIGVFGFWFVWRKYSMFVPINRAYLMQEWRDLTQVALPALTTNLATPLANIYITGQIALFGTQALAGFTIVGRISPVAFALVFAMSGAVSPIFSQNLGAKSYKRLYQTAFTGVGYAMLVVGTICGALFFGNSVVIDVFNAEGDAAFMITQFNTYLGLLFFFTGLQFLSQSGFNALDRAHLSTVLGWSRAIIGAGLGTWYGGTYYGLAGAHAGQYVAGVAFGLVAFALLIRHIRTLERKG